MAASVAFDGFNAQFQIETTPSNFVDLKEILSGSLPDISKDTPDVSHAESPGHARESIAGFLDYGEVTFELNYVQADYVLLLDAMKLDTTTNFKIILDDPNMDLTSPEWAFAAHVTGLSGAVPTDDKVATSVTLKITGVATFTEGTST